MITFASLFSEQPALALAATGGTVLAWGDNSAGQTSTNNGATPTPIKGLSGVIAVSAGALHSLALKSDGTVWTWGDNAVGELGSGTVTPYPSNIFFLPAQVINLTDVIAIATGHSAVHSLALKKDGTVWAWGANDKGQLGIGTFTGPSLCSGNPCSPSPVQVTGMTSVVAIAVGTRHSLALKSDGTVWTWGNNMTSELGNGTYYPLNGTDALASSTPTQVVVGTMQCVPNNGTPFNTCVPLSVGPPLAGVVAIAGGGMPYIAHSLAVASDGGVSGWGYNANGALGNGILEVGIYNGGGTYDHAVATASQFSGIVAIGAGRNSSVALKNDGSVWTAGYGSDGELGNGSYGCTPSCYGSPTPVQVVGVNGVGYLSGIHAVAAGALHVLALKSDSMVVGWGGNGSGQLGAACPSTPLSGACATPIAVNGLSGVTAIAAGGSHSLAVVGAVDTTAPTTTISLSPSSPNGQNGWYRSAVTVSISSADPDDTAGIQTRCALDPTSPPTSFNALPRTSCAYLSPGASVSRAGIHTIYAASQDSAGNTESPVRSGSFNVDATAPAASPSQFPAANANGWNTSDVIVTWNWSDNQGGSGVDQANCTSNSTSSGEGSLILSATCKDIAGNQGTATYMVKVDKTAPVTSATPTAGALYPGLPPITVTGTATITDTAGVTRGTTAFTCFDTRGLNASLTATDKVGGSGVASLTYAASGAQAIASTTVPGATALASISAPGLTTLTYAATDVAGNQEATRSESIIVGAGFACASPTPTFSLPAHGNLVLTGTATINGQRYPFSRSIAF